MSISAKTPTVVDGIEYPYLAVSMAVSPIYGETAVSGCMALTAVPYRTDNDGLIHYAHDHAKRMSVGDIFQKAQTDPLFAQALTTIYGALGQYIYDAGL
jgi:hypothetical protein